MLPAIEIAKLRFHYNTGISIAKLHESTGYSAKTIHKYVRDLVKKTDDERISIVYKATGNIYRTAPICGVSYSTISRALHRIGTPILHKKEKNWRRLYHTLRARASKSQWRKAILNRDNFCCISCHNSSNIVHHKIPLAQLRDDVLREYPAIDPFRSFEELRKFTDLVMDRHITDNGYILCRDCHETTHKNLTTQAKHYKQATLSV